MTSEQRLVVLKKLVKELNFEEHTRFDNWYKLHTKQRFVVRA